MASVSQSQRRLRAGLAGADWISSTNSCERSSCASRARSGAAAGEESVISSSISSFSSTLAMGEGCGVTTGLAMLIEGRCVALGIAVFGLACGVGACLVTVTSACCLAAGLAVFGVACGMGVGLVTLAAGCGVAAGLTVGVGRGAGAGFGTGIGIGADVKAGGCTPGCGGSSTRFSSALKVPKQRPQRTLPRAALSCSVVTRKQVSQWGQCVYIRVPSVVSAEPIGR